jgi:hypothetical protein
LKEKTLSNQNDDLFLCDQDYLFSIEIHIAYLFGFFADLGLKSSVLVRRRGSNNRGDK